jgi:hypothetical protein
MLALDRIILWNSALHTRHHSLLKEDGLHFSIPGSPWTRVIRTSGVPSITLLDDSIGSSLTLNSNEKHFNRNSLDTHPESAIFLLYQVHLKASTMARDDQEWHRWCMRSISRSIISCSSSVRKSASPFCLPFYTSRKRRDKIAA